MRNIATALRRVKERNSALASAEQLPADEFTVADVLAMQIRAVGQQSLQQLRELLHSQVLVRCFITLFGLNLYLGMLTTKTVKWSNNP